MNEKTTDTIELDTDKVLDGNVDDIAADFDKMDDASLQQLLDAENARDETRTTLTGKIEAEQKRRADAAAADQEDADEKARSLGFADAEAQAAHEAKQAEDAKKAKPKRRAKKADAGFKAKAAKDGGRETILSTATGAGKVKILLGNDKRPDRELGAMIARVERKRHLVVNSQQLTMPTETMTAMREFSHAWIFGEDDKPTGAPLAIVELPAPIPAGPGAQVVFPARTLAI